MKKITSIKDLLLEQLRDRYDASKQQAEAYPKLHKAISNEKLKKIIETDVEANKDHFTLLEEIFDKLGEKFEGEQCEGTQALITEAVAVLDYTDQNGEVRDAGIALSVQHINYHDVAGLNGCIIFAEAIGENDIAQKLRTMLANEKTTDESLNNLLKEML